MRSNKARYIKRRRNALLAAAALAIILIVIIIVIIAGITNRSSKKKVEPAATPTPGNVLPTIIPTNEPDASDDPLSTAEPSPTPTGESGTQMFVTGDSVNVRKSASSSADVLTKLAKNTSVTAYGTEGDFYKIKIPSGEIGYMSTKYLSTAKSTATEAPAATPDTSKSTTMYVKGNTVNVRDKASSSGTRITTLSENAKVTAYAETNGWTYVQYASGKYGYISSAYLTAKVASATPTPEATATSTPAPEHASQSDFVTMLGKDDAGKLGTVAEKYLNITKPGQDKIKPYTNITGYDRVYRIAATNSNGEYYIAIKGDAPSYADSLNELQ